MAFVIINIGSNLGNRRLNLSRAVRMVSERFGSFEISHAVESPPWGFGSTHSFLNLAMAFSTDEEPEEILTALQEIEKGISPDSHRTPEGDYADRLIDIDIIAIDRMVIDTPRLTVPHRHLARRRFFLEPLLEIAPGWTHPVSGLDARGMLLALHDDED